jgi:1-deoxy-D-xylulose-5-phosphate synthase
MKKDMSRFLDQIHFSFDVKKLDHEGLEGLCKEIREEILSTVSKNGGHLASNLGVVELTLALHYVFDLPTDKLVGCRASKLHP